MDTVQLVSVIAVVVAVATAAFAARDRHRPGPALSVVALLLAAALWTCLGLVQGSAESLAVKIAMSRSYFVVGGGLATVILWHALVLTGRSRPLRDRRSVLLLVEPSVVALLALVDPWLRLIIDQLRVEDGVVFPVLGPVAWVHVGYCALLFAWAVARLLGARRDAVGAHRGRYTAALLALGFPAAGLVWSILTMASRGASDLTGALFVVTGAVWWWTSRSSSATATIPISVRQVVAALGDPILVIDAGDVVVQANPAAVRMLTSGTSSGQQLTRVGGTVHGTRWQDLVPPLAVEQILAGTALVGWDGRVVEVRSTPVVAGARRNGTVMVLRDVTEVEQLRSDLAEQAVTDGLTGLHNRRHLDQVAERMVAEAHAAARPLVAMMIDIGHFKVVNDTYAHAAGDEVLRSVARELSAGTRAEDLWVRFGGEEFLALLPGTVAREVRPRAETLRRRCRDLRIEVPTGVVEVTVSIGLVDLVPGASVDELLRAADSALYRAKAEGRDRVVMPELGMTAEQDPPGRLSPRGSA